MATSEPVVLHHGREGGTPGHDEARPTASTACWAAFAPGGLRQHARVLRCRFKSGREAVGVPVAREPDLG